MMHFGSERRDTSCVHQPPRSHSLLPRRIQLPCSALLIAEFRDVALQSVTVSAGQRTLSGAKVDPRKNSPGSGIVAVAGCVKRRPG
jgi:hypothetical protein